MKGRALPGAALGAAAWAAATFTGIWTGWGAILVGGLAGGSARLLGAKGGTEALLAAALAGAGMFAGFGFASCPALAKEVAAKADAVSPADYEKFGKAAADWNPRTRGGDRGKFAQAWEILPGSALGGPEARIAEFERTVVPALEAWKKAPPEYEAWRAARRASILAEADAPWSAYLSSPLRFVSGLDLLCAALGLAAAAKVGFVPAPAAIVRSSRPAPPGPI